MTGTQPDRPTEKQLLSQAEDAWKSSDLETAVHTARQSRRLADLSPHGAVSFAWILMSTGQFADAVRLLRRTLVQYPDNCVALARLGQIYKADGRLAAALRKLSCAHLLDTSDTETTRTLGQLTEILGQPEKAIAWLSRTLESPRAKADDKNWLADCLMRDGRSDDAFRLHHEVALAAGTTAAKLTEGLPVEFPTGGFFVGGDPENLAMAIYYARWLPILRRNGPVTFLCSPRIAPSMQRSFPDIRFTETAAAVPNTLRLDQSSLPFLLKNETNEIKTFLRSDPKICARWRSGLRKHFGDRSLIGLSWRSSLTLRPTQFDASTRDRILDLDRQSKTASTPGAQLWRKIIPLGAFHALLTDKRLAMTSVQYGLDRVEVEYINRRLRLPLVAAGVDFLGEMEEVVGFIDALDAVVTIPNTHAHIAAALGKLTIVLAHEIPVPYWGLMRHLCHYPNVKLIQKPLRYLENGVCEFNYAGDWAPTVKRAHEILLSELH
jgi:tetratricopeptide (TPR) repeat protein